MCVGLVAPYFQIKVKLYVRAARLVTPYFQIKVKLCVRAASSSILSD